MANAHGALLVGTVVPPCHKWCVHSCVRGLVGRLVRAVVGVGVSLCVSVCAFGTLHVSNLCLSSFSFFFVFFFSCFVFAFCFSCFFFCDFRFCVFFKICFRDLLFVFSFSSFSLFVVFFFFAILSCLSLFVFLLSLFVVNALGPKHVNICFFYIRISAKNTTIKPPSDTTTAITTQTNTQCKSWRSDRSPSCLGGSSGSLSKPTVHPCPLPWAGCGLLTNSTQVSRPNEPK